MTTNIHELHQKIADKFAALIHRSFLKLNEITIEVSVNHLREICLALRDDPDFDFKMLIDICGVDYLHYGLTEWETTSATATGFERGVEEFTHSSSETETYSMKRSTLEMDSHLYGNDSEHENNNREPVIPAKAGIYSAKSDTLGIDSHLRENDKIERRFASVYHLLSLTHNQRIRIRVFLKDELRVPSVTDIWPAANWFERESYDLFGIFYENHPDLRRILTDYGFVGHPFRKDFPLIGKVEARYDAKAGRVVYEPVSIESRILEPKVIRDDNRYPVEGE